MRTGPDTELKAGEIMPIWRKVKANGGKWAEFRLCKYCKGTGKRVDALKPEKDKRKVQACPHCRSWGFVRQGGGDGTPTEK